jgi:hypothetical protein
MFKNIELIDEIKLFNNEIENIELIDMNEFFNKLKG